MRARQHPMDARCFVESNLIRVKFYLWLGDERHKILLPRIADRVKWARILFTRSHCSGFSASHANRSSSLPSRPTFRPFAHSLARAYLSTCLPA